MKCYIINSTPKQGMVIPTSLILESDYFNYALNTTRELVESLKENGSKKVSFYSSNEDTGVSMASVVHPTVQDFGYADNEHVYFLDGFNPRDYGFASKLTKKDVNLPQALTDKRARSVFLANHNLKNRYGVESMNDFNSRVGNSVAEILEQTPAGYDVVLILPEDVIRICQKNDTLRKLFYFGDETIGLLGGQSKSSILIPFGTVHTAELALPKQVGYDGKIETIAETINKKNEIQLQRQ